MSHASPLPGQEALQRLSPRGKETAFLSLKSRHLRFRGLGDLLKVMDSTSVWVLPALASSCKESQQCLHLFSKICAHSVAVPLHTSPWRCWETGGNLSHHFLVRAECHTGMPQGLTECAWHGSIPFELHHSPYSPPATHTLNSDPALDPWGCLAGKIIPHGRQYLMLEKIKVNVMLMLRN